MGKVTRLSKTLKESNNATIFFLPPLASQIQLTDSGCFHRFQSLPEHQGVMSAVLRELADPKNLRGKNALHPS